MTEAYVRWGLGRVWSGAQERVEGEGKQRRPTVWLHGYSYIPRTLSLEKTRLFLLDHMA